jgi:hypothetical protein
VVRRHCYSLFRRIIQQRSDCSIYFEIRVISISKNSSDNLRILIRSDGCGHINDRERLGIKMHK